MTKDITNPVLGILGVGYFASYFTSSLRNGGYEGEIYLSPRNTKTAERLSQRHRCLIAKDNQDLIDKSDIVLLSVRPEQLSGLLEALTFRDHQIVITAVAGKTITEHYAAANHLPKTLIRMIPVCSIEAGEGVVPIYPPNPQVEKLANFTGTPISFDSEHDFDLALTTSCMNGWLYEFFGTMTNWLEEKGLPHDKARNVILHNIRGATAYALQKEDQKLADITREIATEGTFTLEGLNLLKKQQGFTAWNQALEHVHKKLTE
ncbi:NAD(P)-binding domain-containing protein [Kiloniella sp. EL199]|uniref:NAD(P)-binding domain-containing protein n=1 Tax=Kiloniella sp. EL199 TaxID=2107581 RepID=UPI000EA3FADF|nr:NAD(P)-binding domain-containing protein [Kiloniella sp. EL199]